MLNVKSKKLSEMWEELSALFVLHHKELSIDLSEEMNVLNPDKQAYTSLEAHNLYHTLFLYDDEKLIGYSGNLITPDLHNQGIRLLNTDVLFLHPDYRGHTIGLFLIQETENLARDLGLAAIVLNVRAGTKMVELLPMLDYQIQDVSFIKKV